MQDPKKHTISLLLLVIVATFIFSANVQGQSTLSLPLQIIAAGGGEARGSNLLVDFTIGEPVAELSTSTTLYLNQGFQQNHFDNIELVTQSISFSDHNLSLYPNPIENHLIIEKTNAISAANAHILFIRIYNLLGQVTYEGQFQSDIIKINSREWQAGTYFIHIESSEGEHAQKTIIKH